LEIVSELWQQDFRECQYAALDLLEKNKKKLLNETHIPFLEQLIIEKSWWDTVDLNAANIIGHILKENHSLLVKKTNEWMNLDNIWLKRTAILAQLKYKSATDFELLKKVTLHLKEEPDFFIRKSIGWAFREYAKVNFEAVETLVLANNFSALTKKEALKNKS
jgi:3-methyladenine DNA glycosylase AlkD